MLQVVELSKEYTRNKQNFFAVDNVSFSLEKGEYCAIIGHSGSGKSTLFSMITGMLKPTTGEILFDGMSLSKKSDIELSNMRNKKIGYVMQGQSLLPNFTLIDNICMPFYLNGEKSEILQKARNHLQDVGLAQMEHAYPKELSGGEIRRAAIARALINNPDLIVADEPTSNLDPDTAKMIISLFSEMAKQGKTLLVSTHDMEFLNHIHTGYRMEKGILTNDIALR